MLHRSVAWDQAVHVLFNLATKARSRITNEINTIKSRILCTLACDLHHQLVIFRARQRYWIERDDEPSSGRISFGNFLVNGSRNQLPRFLGDVLSPSSGWFFFNYVVKLSRTLFNFLDFSKYMNRSSSSQLFHAQLFIAAIHGIDDFYSELPKRTALSPYAQTISVSVVRWK